HPKAFFDALSSDQLIIKPTISAGADNTFWLNRANMNQSRDQLKTLFFHRTFIVQPFMPHILRVGEFTHSYFGNTSSHAILKTPKEDDFRLQDEHGGRLQTIEPETELKRTAEDILALLDPLPLYTRIDIVRTARNTFALMEL